MPQGVEHYKLRAGELVAAWRVHLAVMPQGVEHNRTRAHVPGLDTVHLAVMPQGVEHSNDITAARPVVGKVHLAVMPQGVGHKMIAAGTIRGQ